VAGAGRYIDCRSDCPFSKWRGGYGRNPDAAEPGPRLGGLPVHESQRTSSVGSLERDERTRKIPTTQRKRRSPDICTRTHARTHAREKLERTRNSYPAPARVSFFRLEGKKKMRVHDDDRSDALQDSTHSSSPSAFIAGTHLRESLRVKTTRGIFPRRFTSGKKTGALHGAP